MVWEDRRQQGRGRRAAGDGPVAADASNATNASEEEMDSETGEVFVFLAGGPF